MIDIIKEFPGNRAVDKVNFDSRAGEVHCIVGENGAGKSTLMKMLAGVHQPDSGTILLDGQKTIIHDNVEARKNGIGVVYQELSLLPDCSVAENISMGMWPRKGVGIDWNKINRRAV
ncbi:MAG: sugar ABC transporter ATP-binding protein, partial [Chitinispirillaceae bacterium]|nr:sugar ABC transporter ATP-binding protein [Chitinispirillaceae bacterium]